MSSLTLTQYKIYYKTTSGNQLGISDTNYFILDVAYDPNDSNKVQNIFSSDVSPKGDIGLIVGTSACGSVNLGSNQITLFMNQIPTLNGISTAKIQEGSTEPYEFYALKATTISSIPGAGNDFEIQGWNGSAFINIFTNNSDAYVYANPVTTVTGVTIDGSNLITDLPDYDAATQNPILADLVNLGYTRTQIFNLVGSSTSNLNTVISYFKNNTTILAATLYKLGFSISELYNNGTGYTKQQIANYNGGNYIDPDLIVAFTPFNYVYYSLIGANIGWQYSNIKSVLIDKFGESGAQNKLCAPASDIPIINLTNDLGYSYSQIYNNGNGRTIRDFKLSINPAISANQLKGSFTSLQLYDGGNSYTIQLLYGVGYGVIDITGLPATGFFSITDFKTDGIPVTVLKSAGFSASQLKQAGFTATELKAALFTATELKAALFTATELKTAGFTASELKTALFTATELKTAGFTATQLKDVGFTLTELKTAGFSAQEIYNIMKTLSYTDERSRSELLTLGYTEANISLLTELQQLQSVICFPAKTPVKTDQGYVHIDKIDKRVHTIRGEKIVAITKTVSKENHLVCIKKNALAKNMPSEKTYISKNHCVLYKGKMVEAKKLVALIDNGLVEFVEYTGETLYNVLLEEHSKIVVNNMICETLHPFNKIAIFHTCTNFYNVSELEQQILVEEFNKIEKQMMNMRR